MRIGTGDVHAHALLWWGSYPWSGRRARPLRMPRPGNELVVVKRQAEKGTRLGDHGAVVHEAVKHCAHVPVGHARMVLGGPADDVGKLAWCIAKRVDER